MGAVLLDRRARFEPFDSGARRKAGDGYTLQRPPLLAAHARRRLFPGALDGEHDFQIGREGREARAEVTISRGDFQDPPRSLRADEAGERAQEGPGREQVDRSERGEFAHPGELATRETGERAVERGGGWDAPSPASVPEQPGQGG